MESYIARSYLHAFPLVKKKNKQFIFQFCNFAYNRATVLLLLLLFLLLRVTDGDNFARLCRNVNCVKGKNVLQWRRKKR